MTAPSSTPVRPDRQLRRRVLITAVVVVVLAAAVALVAALRAPDGEGWVAADGTTCEGWVSARSVEAAIGESLANVDMEVWRTPGLATIACEVYVGEDLVLSLESWTMSPDSTRSHHDIEGARQIDGAIDGPLEGSVIGPATADPDAQGVVAAAEVQVADGLRQVIVRMPTPADDVDAYAVSGQLLEELAASAEQDPPRPGEGADTDAA